MPYIKPEKRKSLERGVHTKSATVGDLNYTICVMLNQWLKVNDTNYANINSAIGVLECAKLELYRRIAVPYEETKIEENGDIF